MVRRWERVAGDYLGEGVVWVGLEEAMGEVGRAEERGEGGMWMIMRMDEGDGGCDEGKGRKEGELGEMVLGVDRTG